MYWIFFLFVSCFRAAKSDAKTAKLHMYLGCKRLHSGIYWNLIRGLCAAHVGLQGFLGPPRTWVIIAQGAWAHKTKQWTRSSVRWPLNEDPWHHSWTPRSNALQKKHAVLHSESSWRLHVRLWWNSPKRRKTTIWGHEVCWSSKAWCHSWWFGDRETSNERL